MDADLALLKEVGVDAAYRPSTKDMYPDGFQVSLAAGPAALRFEGAARPGHFDGMLTVVMMLSINHQRLPIDCRYSRKQHGWMNDVSRCFSLKLQVPHVSE